VDFHEKNATNKLCAPWYTSPPTTVFIDCECQALPSLILTRHQVGRDALRISLFRSRNRMLWLSLFALECLPSERMLSRLANQIPAV